MIIRYMLAWVMLLLAAIVNGLVRQSFLLDPFGEARAHQLSTLTAILLFAVIIWVLTRRWPLASAVQAWTIGFTWLGMTLAFEFLFFHYVGGKPWDELLEDYNILRGRLWVLIPLWVTVAPYIFYRLRGTP